MPIVNKVLGCILASWKKKKKEGTEGRRGKSEKGREDGRKGNVKRETKG